MRAILLLAMAGLVAARRGGKPCEYEKPAQLSTALKAGGCDTDPKSNGNFDCSVRCARHYMPIERRCRIMFNKLKLGKFTKDCRQALHPHSADHETGRECRDGKDNDHDGKKDCQDPDCAHFRGCRKDNPKTETGRECHDGHDNDHDGKDDCKDPDCARHPCCTGLCKQKKFQSTHPWCKQKYCVASGQSSNAGGAACNTARLLPTVLSCQSWLRQAEKDGKITPSDGFCTSSCFEEVKPIWGQCQNRMSKANEKSLAFVAPLIPTCEGHTHETAQCRMETITRACGANAAKAKERCDGRCLKAIDTQSEACQKASNGQAAVFHLWGPIISHCADTHDAENCAAASDKFLKMVDDSCCADKTCKDVPKKCTEECAATFLPYFSRCGRAVFGRQRSALRKMEKFNRRCAYTAGRNVHKVKEGSDDDPFAQMDGPNSADICSHTDSCQKCHGNCGWCAAEVENKHALHKNGGGWCSSECVTTRGECRAHGGRKKHEGGALCFNHKDDDGDHRADCDDSDCRKDPRAKLHCKFTETGRECFDGKDNDHDGHKDCADQDCLNDPRVRARCRAQHRHINHETGKQCFDGVDNDHDHLTDCDDPDCRRDPRAAARCKHTETGKECFDGRDNDRDGKKDCADPDCLKDRRAARHCRGIHHKGGHETGHLCFNGKDDDGDGVADCDDPDCQKDKRSKGHCRRTETGKECFDGRDNDRDGKKDCQDPDCLNDPSYGGKVRRWCRKHKGGHETGRECFDGKDNDGDGGVDCDDADCRKDPRAFRHCIHTETGKECFDGKDNDGDGHKDCDDPDCRKDPSWGGKIEKYCAAKGKGGH